MRYLSTGSNMGLRTLPAFQFPRVFEKVSRTREKPGMSKVVYLSVLLNFNVQLGNISKVLNLNLYLELFPSSSTLEIFPNAD